MNDLLLQGLEFLHEWQGHDRSELLIASFDGHDVFIFTPFREGDQVNGFFIGIEFPDHIAIRIIPDLEIDLLDVRINL